MEPSSRPYQQLVLEVTCRHILRSTAFYRTLGFELIRAEEHFVELSWDERLLFLDERPDYVPNLIPAGNLRIMVPDVDAVWERCVQLELPVHSAIENRYYGLRDFTILDPDGFGLRFATAIPTLQT
jgi:catechol 2,3-dioxygenase-like lactoylglutathione lyase family enzyme